MGVVPVTVAGAASVLHRFPPVTVQGPSANPTPLSRPGLQRWASTVGFPELICAMRDLSFLLWVERMKKASGTALVEAPQWLRDGLNEQLPHGEESQNHRIPSLTLRYTSTKRGLDSLLIIHYHHFFPH